MLSIALSMLLTLLPPTSCSCLAAPKTKLLGLTKPLPGLKERKDDDDEGEAAAVQKAGVVPVDAATGNPKLNPKPPSLGTIGVCEMLDPKTLASYACSC